MKYRREQGFTLIEVMIVIAIIGILATLAYPSYSGYIIRGRIPEGLAMLANERVVMEKFLADNRSYQVGGVHACARYPVTTRYFSLACAGTPTGITYTLQATGIGSMAGFDYTIDQTGAKATVAAGRRAGWAVPSPANDCWALKKDGSC